MKPDFSSRYNTVAVYILIVLLFTVLCVFTGYYFPDIIDGAKLVVSVFKPVIYGLVMAFLFSPVLLFFEKRVFAFCERKKSRPKLRTFLSLTATYLIVAAAAFLFFIIIIPQAAASYKDLENKLSGYVAAAQNWIENTMAGLPEINIGLGSTSVPVPEPVFVKNMDGTVPNVIVSRINGTQSAEMSAAVRSVRQDSLRYSAAEIISGFISDSYKLFSDLTPYVLDALMKLLTETKNIVLGVIISVYYLYDRKTIAARLQVISETLLPDGLRGALGEFISLVNLSFMQFVNGKVIDAAIIGFLCFILMSVFGMPYAPLIGLLVGVTGIIPYIGLFLGAVPGAFIIFVADPPMTFWFILLIVALQQANLYFIEPHVLHSQIRLDAVWIIISVVMTGEIFGIAGLFAGVPVFAVFYVLIKRRAEQMLVKKGLPPETSAWTGRSEP